MHNYISGTRYRHYKWGQYEIVCEATSEADMKSVVVYRGLWDTPEHQRVWVREKSVFESLVITTEGEVPRFTLL